MPPGPSDQFKNILGSKDPNRPFPVSESGDGLLKWRMQSKDASAVPLTSKFLYVPISILDDVLILLEVTSIVSIKGGPPPKYS
nr:coatomer subunit delta-like [Tanacetum cinerariifolium]